MDKRIREKIEVAKAKPKREWRGRVPGKKVVLEQISDEEIERARLANQARLESKDWQLNLQAYGLLLPGEKRVKKEALVKAMKRHGLL